MAHSNFGNYLIVKASNNSRVAVPMLNGCIDQDRPTENWRLLVVSSEHPRVKAAKEKEANRSTQMGIWSWRPQLFWLEGAVMFGALDK